MQKDHQKKGVLQQRTTKLERMAKTSKSSNNMKQAFGESLNDLFFFGAESHTARAKFHTCFILTLIEELLATLICKRDFGPAAGTFFFVAVYPRALDPTT